MVVIVVVIVVVVWYGRCLSTPASLLAPVAALSIASSHVSKAEVARLIYVDLI
jgi:hypothetical protein